jgi:AcrR family transcriptional regulator
MKPTGREAVRDALVDAAARLFAQRGPSNVSVREIAAEAGVNHGLVHRHFGAKERLLGEVLDRLAARVDAGLGPDADALPLPELLRRTFATTRAHRLYWHVLARAILEGMEPASLQRRFPVVERLVRALEKERGLPIDPASAATLAVALGLGMMVFEPYLRAASGLDATRWRALEKMLPSLLTLAR